MKIIFLTLLSPFIVLGFIASCAYYAMHVGWDMAVTVLYNIFK